MRRCGCPADPAVFGHTTCPAGPPWMAAPKAQAWQRIIEIEIRERWAGQAHAAAMKVHFNAIGVPS